jgi:hypothetical protein
MTQEQLAQKEQERMDIIVNQRIFYSYDELLLMSPTDRANAILQMKQDETMKWQRLASQLHYYVMICSIIVGGLAAFILLLSKN